jgi:hypothetical protein
MEHPVYMNILNCSNLVLIDDAPAMLVGKVAPPLRDAFMHTSNRLAGFTIGGCILSQLRPLTPEFGKWMGGSGLSMACAPVARTW